MTTSELQQAVSTAAAYMKFVCGVGNNAAWLVTLDAYDQAKKHRNWEKRVKGGHTVKSLYKMVIKAHKNYERNLIYTDTNRMFHVADMSPETRKMFGDISDSDYFDYWASVGAAHTPRHVRQLRRSGTNTGSRSSSQHRAVRHHGMDNDSYRSPLHCPDTL